MNASVSNCDFSQDLLIRINPGIIEMKDYVNVTTPSEISKLNLATLITQIDVSDEFDAAIVAVYPSLADLFGADPLAKREIIPLVPTTAGGIFSFPTGLKNTPQEFYNALKRQNFMQQSGFSQITFYIVNMMFYTAVTIGDLPLTGNYFVVFHYIP